MANSEDYTVVWAGLCLQLAGDEVEQAERGVHPLILNAKNNGLQHWFDTFDYAPQGEQVFHLLIGEQLDLLGYKEGRSRLSLARPALVERCDRIDAALRVMGVASRCEIYVLLHIQE
jgi:hypothetical protein